jgi:hypothetical protein
MEVDTENVLIKILGIPQIQQYSIRIVLDIVGTRCRYFIWGASIKKDEYATRTKGQSLLFGRA